jgi:hypothetical protein
MAINALPRPARTFRSGQTASVDSSVGDPQRLQFHVGLVEHIICSIESSAVTKKWAVIRKMR